jgi:FkbM family methyltransferase
MKRIRGYWWPDDVEQKWEHALRHVRSLEWALAHAQKTGRTRVAVQAGGNMGLWPRRMADVFLRVVTFEPDAESRACLVRNVDARVEVCAEALGAEPGWCDIKHRSLGSHQVVGGADVPVTTIDALGLMELDFLQLDIEGYEWHALQGAAVTLARCRPLVQLELRGFTEKYGASDAAVVAFLARFGYREVSRQRGNDVVFEACP